MPIDQGYICIRMWTKNNFATLVKIWSHCPLRLQRCLNLRLFSLQVMTHTVEDLASVPLLIKSGTHFTKALSLLVRFVATEHSFANASEGRIRKITNMCIIIV